jgi:hypothetical protein
VDGKMFVAAGGSIGGVSVDINGFTADNTLNLLGALPPGAVIFNGRYLFGGGPIDELFSQGIPYLVQDFRYLTNPLFLSNKGVLIPSSLKNVVAEIINKWQQPEPFDLRLIEVESNAGGSETYQLLMFND